MLNFPAHTNVIHLEDDTKATYQASSTDKTHGDVLMIQGWAGHMDEVGDLYKRLSDQLAQLGISSVRINIRGEAEAPMTG